MYDLPGMQDEDVPQLPHQEEVVKHHPLLNGLPCDIQGEFLPEGAPPPPWEDRPKNDWYPFESGRPAFELSDLLFVKDQMSAMNINDLLQIWASTVSYNGPGSSNPNGPSWKHANYDQQVGNRDFAEEMDFAPKEDKIAEDPTTHGSTFCPVILGSDKTTNDYYPIYISNGLVHNNVRRAHRNALMLLGFLAIPKTDKTHEDSDEFRVFRRQLFHASLNRILQSLRPWMEKPDVVRYADGHYRRTIYGLGPYIADYPEQVLLACIVQNWCARDKVLWDDYGIVDGIMPFTHGFPRADIHELLSPDLLHQIIKGTFKDHLVTWVTDYIEAVNTPADAKKILADIDNRIAAAPSFAGLHRFPEGHGFKQWTGDDSKALMKVYLPAIAGHVPAGMVRAISSFMEFCYLVRRSFIDDDDLVSINEAVRDFHRYRVAFDLVRPDGYSLPRQHSLTHYTYLIKEFGAPNGLCSSIMESKHIKAVKEPWRHSNHYEALGQMLVTNQHLDKLMMARAVDGDLDADVILSQKPLPHFPRHPDSLSHYLNIPHLHTSISCFLYEQLHPDDDTPLDNIPQDQCPHVEGKVWVYPSAVATYHAPSDRSGIPVKSWRKVFLAGDTAQQGFRGLLVARVRLFLSVTHHRVSYPCALVEWFSTPDYNALGERAQSVVHLDSIMRCVHLMPVAGNSFISQRVKFHNSLDAFEAYYVNKDIDYHAHEIAF
ncbi:hypothetical protein CPB84DRAFT_1816950 [Gymnopilus junonius]|uniref:Uncharacterized protein n=1 Tax=Gymnopilus junonius TaxID=109634 RepID=A0A9P5NDT6_GYMJU|nr:hypothetical protein CPB84DRAFT_1816950 [Gymnopilus junonius]